MDVPLVTAHCRHPGPAAQAAGDDSATCPTSASRCEIVDGVDGARRLWNDPLMVRRIALLSTGGTIEKTYNESDGTISNQRSVLEIMLAGLILRGVQIERIPVMNKDSQFMTDEDHERIATVAGVYQQSHDGLVVTHGTDRLQYTGERLCERLGTPRVPIVLTGAMRPYELRNTDALQNLTEALLAVQLVAAGVYVAMHNQVLQFPGVVKDHAELRFIKRPA
jgi:L-asparaginase